MQTGSQLQDVYDQHRAHFGSRRAFAVTFEGKYLASIAIIYTPVRIYSYVQWFGKFMTRSFVGGGGYDRATAVVEKTVAQWPESSDLDCQKFTLAIRDSPANCGISWDTRLTNAGFELLQVL